MSTPEHRGGPSRLVREDGGPAPLDAERDDALVTERASAAPKGVDSAPSAPEQPAAPGSAVEGVSGPLREVQAWFAAVITHPEGAAAGVEAARAAQEELGAESIEKLVTRGARQSALERLELYHYAYHARLVECLADDFSVVKYALGKDVFRVLAKRYILQHPSNHPSLNPYGARFPDFCAAQEDLQISGRFVSELARFEWAMVEVLHAEQPAAVSMESIQALPPERWADVRLPASPTVCLLTAEHPVNAYYGAWREDQTPSPPEPEWSCTAIYRRNFRVWRMGFTPPMAAVLSALFAGATLGEALAELEAHARPDHPEDAASEQNVMGWFREWVEAGFFARIELPDSDPSDSDPAAED